ncbi:DNA repair protein [Mycena indigotica]|uniref:DNA repair protein REV1 n=1 Tax=Mycena indigotica TaxID=2126181 RepID=A0A8H6T604_9AGAR|nr:DNA repair protein [Mycena indigotica]KAF7312418.1 DNA repair protein [Mycena indigotica]
MPSYAASSDYFSEEDPSWVAALHAAVLPGDLPPSSEPGSPASEEFEPPPPAQPRKRRYEPSPEADPVDEVIYGAAHFGDFGEYMQRKRAKLQIQNSEMVDAAHSRIFAGLAIYVNGQTDPPQHELRRILVENGGIFEPYLVNKGKVTHIVTDNLTDAKIREFKNMKVVRPQWLTESVKSGSLLPWKDFVWTKDVAPAATQAIAPSIPRYAANPSNLNAQRVMAEPGWRTANTAAAPGYVKNYYQHSRLHFLSTAKSELQQLVREARVQAENPGRAGIAPISPRKGKGRDEERVIMHCDFDCFFVSASLLKRPELRGKPVVVCHSQDGQGGDGSTSEVACASYEARALGVKNGMSLRQARQYCPQVITMPYEFESYKKISLKFYTILLSRADDVEAVSIDEALIDVTHQIRKFITSPDPAKEFAEHLRAEVKGATECEISIGISHNVLLARLANRRAKPAGSLHVLPQDVPELISTLNITDLRGFAASARVKAEEKLGSIALKDLAKKTRAALSDALGPKTGEKLYNAIRGIDDTPLVSDRQPQSVSAELNYGIRFKSDEEAAAFLMEMGSEVEQRLHAVNVLGRSLTLKVMKRHPDAPVEGPKFMGHGKCEDFSKQVPLSGPGGRATSDGKIIGEIAYKLLKSFRFDPQDLRGIGIQIQKLEPLSGPINRGPNQQMLPFQRPENASIINHQAIGQTDPFSKLPTEEAPSDISGLPPYEAVDPDVFRELPPSIQGEMRQHWARSESVSPRKAVAQVQPRNVTFRGPVKSIFPTRHGLQRGNRPLQSKYGPTNNRFIDKKFFESRKLRNRREQPNDKELHELGIDLDWWAELQKDNTSKNVLRDILREQRILVANGGKAPTPPTPKEHKPKKYVPRPDLYRHPLPQAKYPDLPRLAQRVHNEDKPKKTKAFFKETDDVQNLVEAWVDSFKNFPPEAQDIEYVSKFLTKAMDSKQFTDTSVERTIAVVKWWLELLRRYWGDYEFYARRLDEQEEGEVAEAWWKAFRDVKEQLDIIARKKWGGRLAIR